jgi:hypothetical protein
MSEFVFDVHLEIDPLKLAGEYDPTRAVAELSRHVAEERCAERGATLRHPDPREVHVRQAIKPITGDVVLLVATRWIADGPAA